MLQMTPERKEKMETVLSHRQSDLVVVLENVQDPHNIGAVMRSADSVGVQDIFLINTKLSTENYAKKRSSASAEKWLTVHEFETVADAVKALRTEGFKLWGTHLGTAAKPFYEIDFCEKVALIFGNEKEGISEELLSHCDGNFVIPQVGMIQSLNISVACAVSLYEAFRQRNEQQKNDPQIRLNVAQRTKLFAKWTAVYEK